MSIVISQKHSNQFLSLNYSMIYKISIKEEWNKRLRIHLKKKFRSLNKEVKGVAVLRNVLKQLPNSPAFWELMLTGNVRISSEII